MATSRRTFLKNMGVVGFVVAAVSLDKFDTLQFIRKIDNPFAFYPRRDWEKIYRDQYHYDRTFTYIYAPNDTHNCRMGAFARNDDRFACPERRHWSAHRSRL